MILAQLVFVGILLHLIVATPLFNANQDYAISDYAYNNLQDPHLWENSGKFQGDMVLTSEQETHLSSRNGVIDHDLRWPNRQIPYEFSSSFSSKERDFIVQALENEYSRTCVSVVPRTNERDYVYITAEHDGCWSSVGRKGGRQKLNLKRKGCLGYSTIVHEFLHAAGFYHQHSAAERDDHIIIKWENIKSGHEHNFNKYNYGEVSSYGQPYDYGSVMHYEAYAFSKNGKRTIVPKVNVNIGKAPRLSEIDIKKLNKMYNC